MQDSLAGIDAATLASRIRAKVVSPIEALDAIVAVIEQHNGGLNAFCTLSFDRARNDAVALERRISAGEAVGVLAGVPISIKDLILTKGIRTTGGSLAYRDLIPDEDDIVVERLKAADAIIVGKTNVSELGYSLTGDNPVFGVTRNPWDRQRTSGGSSAGAAVAIATGMGPIAIGSDGGGSIRLPAAYCGVFGFKPSMGRVPLYPGCRDERYPGLSSWESLEHIGPLTRTVADAALAMNVMAGPDRRDRHSLPLDIADWGEFAQRAIKGRRIGYCPTLAGVAVDPEIKALTDVAARVFETELGCVVEEAAPEWGNPLLHFRALMAMDSDLKGMRELVARLKPNVSVNLVQFVEHDWSAEMITEAVKARKAVCNAMWRLFERFDLLLTPVSATLPPPADKRDGAEDFDRPLPYFTCVGNMAGVPAASIPAGLTSGGLPVGVQIIGDHLCDLDVLAAAASFERARPWRFTWQPS